MNEHDAKLRAELEQATARPGRGAAGPLSSEGAELRESWLAFGQLLESADRSFDPAKLLAKLEPECHAAAVAARADEGVARRGLDWRAAAKWAVAASLLIGALAAAWRWRNEGGSSPDEAPVAKQRTSGGGASDVPGPQIAHERPDAGPRGGDEAAGGGAPETSLAGVDAAQDAATAWDDSFDEQLAATQWRLAQVGATSSASEVRYESLRQAIEQFDSELSGSSL